MKKQIIITALIFFAASAFAQQGSQERTSSRQSQKKSETSENRQQPRQAIRQQTSHQDPIRNSKNSSSIQNKTIRESAVYDSKPDNRPANKPGIREAEQGKEHYRTPGRHPERSGYSHHAVYKPVNVVNVRHPYRVPVNVHVIWNNSMYYEYRKMYPDFRHWNYQTGYRVGTIASYSAYHHVGEVRNVYGRVNEVWYSWETDEYYLYFGASYPCHEFTLILQGSSARRFSRHPELYFSGRYVWATGLISLYDGRPELMAYNKSQVHPY